jgi:hypothetical protein
VTPTIGTYTLVIAPDPATVAIGESQQFSASIVNSADGLSAPVQPGPNTTWATNAGAITQDGLYTPTGDAIGSGGDVPWFVSCTVTDFVPT